MRASGLGSMPGRDFREATRVVAELMPDILAWPELPGRDSSSAIIGRTLGLVSLPCALGPEGWRLTTRRTGAQDRAQRWWRTDLDDFEELTVGYGGVVKVALAGPWTLATQVRLTQPTMTHVIADLGACRELTWALAEAAASLVAQLRARLGQAVIVQLDEPVIGSVLAGALPTYSGLHRYRTPPVDEVIASWQTITAALSEVAGCWLHSCGPTPAIELARRAGFTGSCCDARYLGASELDACGQWLEAGGTFGLGIVRTDEVLVPRRDQIVADAVAVLRRLELAPDLLAAQVVLTPACGLGGWPPVAANQLLGRLVEAAPLVAEELAN